mmetsp:Transcript_2993/g.10136  ORF Transcript_2993/g.10136 Transcript_2993/m.10136 type:complete len:255 (-) Transcript_2993:333-1097(-)
MPNLAWTISPCSVTRRRPSTDPGGCDWMARYMGPPPRPTDPPRPWKRVSATPNSLHTFTISCCDLKSAQLAARRPASFPESEYPSITSWWLLWVSRRCEMYHLTLKRRRSTPGALSRSSSVSNSGTTRSEWPGQSVPLSPLSICRASRCSSSTASTSLAKWVIEITYAPREWLPSCAATRHVSSTSLTLSLTGIEGGTSGRLELSSLTRKSMRSSSPHSLYEPMPRYWVTVSRHSEWRSLSCRRSSFMSTSPKQ